MNRDIQNQAEAQTLYSFNGHLELTQLVTPMGETYSYEYDDGNPSRRAQGNLLARTHAGPVGSGQTVTTAFAYEPDLNLVSSVTDPQGRTTRYHYGHEEYLKGDLNGDGVVGAASARIVRIEQPRLDPDHARLTAYHTDRTTLLEYDHIGYPTRVTYPDGEVLEIERTFSAGASVVLAGHTVGNWTGIPSAERHTTTLFNRFEPGPGGLVWMSQESVRSDGFERVTETADATGATTRYTWDDQDRLTSIQGHGEPVPHTVMAYTPDGNVWKTTTNHFTRLPNGTIEIESSTTEAFVRDELGRIRTKIQGVGAPGPEQPSVVYESYRYDRNSNLVMLKRHDAYTWQDPLEVETFVYDERDQLAFHTVGGKAPLFSYLTANQRVLSNHITDPFSLHLNVVTVDSHQKDEPPQVETFQLEPTPPGLSAGNVHHPSAPHAPWVVPDGHILQYIPFDDAMENVSQVMDVVVSLLPGAYSFLIDPVDVPVVGVDLRTPGLYVYHSGGEAQIFVIGPEGHVYGPAGTPWTIAVEPGMGEATFETDGHSVVATVSGFHPDGVGGHGKVSTDGQRTAVRAGAYNPVTGPMDAEAEPAVPAGVPLDGNITWTWQSEIAEVSFKDARIQLTFWASGQDDATANWHARLWSGDTLVSSTPAGGVALGELGSSPKRYTLNLPPATFSASTLRLELEKDPQGGPAMIYVDSPDYPSRIEIGNARTTTYERDGAGRVTAEIAPDGSRTEHSYDGLGRRDRTVTETATWQRDFDALDRIVAERVFGPVGGIAWGVDASRLPQVLLSEAKYTYDSGRNLYRVDRGLFDPATGEALPDKGVLSPGDGYETTLYGYDPQGRRVVDIQDNGAETHTTYGVFGPKSTRDALGNVEVYEYDQAGRLTATHYHARDDAGNLSEARTTSHTYDEGGRRIATTDPVGRTTHYGYDSQGNLAWSADDNEGAPGNLVRHEYDALGRLVATHRELREGGTGAGGLLGVATTTNVWDGNGRLIAQTDAAGHTTRYSHDRSGFLVNTTFADGTYKSHVLDAGGNANAIRTGKGSIVTEVGSNGLPLRRTFPDSTQMFEYDGLGRPTWSLDTNDAGQDDDAVVATGYDSLGRVQWQSQNDRDFTYSYDAVGNVESFTRPGGSTISYAYDLAGRLVQVERAGAVLHSQDYVEARKVSERAGNGVETTWSHNAALDIIGALVEQPVLPGQTEPPGWGYTYEYDERGNRDSFTYSGTNLVTSYAYDSLARLVSATRPASTGILASESKEWSLDSANNWNALDDGVAATWTHDGANAYQSKAKGSTVLSYGYDAQGNQVARGNRSLEWDLLNRLQGLSVNGTVVVQYDYDAFDRRVHATSNGGTWSTYDGSDLVQEYNATHLLRSYIHGQGTDEPLVMETWVPTEGSTAGNGTRGNATSPGSTGIEEPGSTPSPQANNTDPYHLYPGAPLPGTHVTENPTDLVQVEEPAGIPGTNIQEADPEPVVSPIGGVPSLHALANETGSSGPSASGNATPGGEATRYYYHRDALGSVTALTDEAGRVVVAYHYGPYGQATVIRDGDGVLEWGLGDEALAQVGDAGDPAWNPFLFTGQRYDPDTGLYYYKARYYDPDDGRFMSRDPIGVWGDGNNLGNAYAYVGNNPVAFVDATGTTACFPGSTVNCAMASQYQIEQEFRRLNECFHSCATSSRANPGAAVRSAVGSCEGWGVRLDSFTDMACQIRDLALALRGCPEDRPDCVREELGWLVVSISPISVGKIKQGSRAIDDQLAKLNRYGDDVGENVDFLVESGGRTYRMPGHAQVRLAERATIEEVAHALSYPGRDALYHGVTRTYHYDPANRLMVSTEGDTIVTVMQNYSPGRAAKLFGGGP